MEGLLCTQLEWEEGVSTASSPLSLEEPVRPQTKETDNTDSRSSVRIRARPPAQVQHRPVSPLFPGVSATSVSMVTASFRPRRYGSPPSAALSGRRSGKPRGLVVLLPAAPLGAPPKGFAPSRAGSALEASTWKAGTSIPEAGRSRLVLPLGGCAAGAPAPRPPPRGRRADQAPQPPAHPAPPGLVPAFNAPSSSAHSSPDRCRQLPWGHCRGRMREPAPEPQLTPHHGLTKAMNFSGQRGRACARAGG